MSALSGYREALSALTGRSEGVQRGAQRLTSARRGPASTPAGRREELAQVLYLGEQGEWGSSSPDGPAGGTPWGTSTERFLRDRYLRLADAVLAAGYRRSPACTREQVEEAQREQGATADADEWILVAWSLGIDVGTSA